MAWKWIVEKYMWSSITWNLGREEHGYAVSLQQSNFKLSWNEWVWRLEETEHRCGEDWKSFVLIKCVYSVTNLIRDFMLNFSIIKFVQYLDHISSPHLKCIKISSFLVEFGCVLKIYIHFRKKNWGKY